MKHTEAILAIRHLAAYFPNQKFDEFTADAWATALISYEYLDAMDAIKAIATRPLRQGQSFLLELRDVTGELDSMLARRMESRRGAILEPPSDLDPDDYVAWMRTQYASIKRRDWEPPVAIEYPDAPPEIVEQLANAWSAER